MSVTNNSAPSYIHAGRIGMQVSTVLVPRSRTLRVQVLGASVLPTETKVQGKYTTSDPYVRLALGAKPTKDRGWKHQTRPVMKTLMPRWEGTEATFELAVGTANAASASAHELHFQVMEKDKGLNPDDFLGCGCFKTLPFSI